MRRFELHRDTDISGVSGTGVVVEGVQFSDGVVALRWKSENPSTVIYENGIEAVEKIHGHNGATRLVWVDSDADELVARAKRESTEIKIFIEESKSLRKKAIDTLRKAGLYVGR